MSSSNSSEKSAEILSVNHFTINTGDNTRIMAGTRKHYAAAIADVMRNLKTKGVASVSHKDMPKGLSVTLMGDPTRPGTCVFSIYSNGLLLTSNFVCLNEAYSPVLWDFALSQARAWPSVSGNSNAELTRPSTPWLATVINEYGSIIDTIGDKNIVWASMLEGEIALSWMVGKSSNESSLATVAKTATEGEPERAELKRALKGLTAENGKMTHAIESLRTESNAKIHDLQTRCEDLQKVINLRTETILRETTVVDLKHKVGQLEEELLAAQIEVEDAVASLIKVQRTADNLKGRNQYLSNLLAENGIPFDRRPV